MYSKNDLKEQKIGGLKLWNYLEKTAAGRHTRRATVVAKLIMGIWKYVFRPQGHYLHLVLLWVCDE